MAFWRRRSFQGKVPRLLKINLSARYCERKYQQYLVEGEESKFINIEKVSETIFAEM